MATGSDDPLPDTGAKTERALSPETSDTDGEASISVANAASMIQVNRQSRMVEMMESSGRITTRVTEARSQPQRTMTPPLEEPSDMESLMWCYGFASSQLDAELYPEKTSMEKAAQERTGVWLFFLKLNSSACFMWLCFAVIFANSIFMGFQANATAAFSRGEMESMDSYHVMETIFILWFIVESVIRCLGSSIPVYRDRFLLFDILVITLSAVELWLLKPLDILQGGLVVSFFAVFRVLRLTRAVKLVRAVEIFRSLYTMLQAVWQSKLTFLSVVVVLFMLILVTGLVLMALVGPVSGLQAGKDLPEPVAARFRNVQRTMLTLLETLLRGDEWGENIVRPLLTHGPARLAGVLFIAFAAFGQFFLLNLISGIFIEAMFKTVRVNSVTLEHEHIYVDQHGADNLKRAFLEIGSGRKSLTWNEFSKALAMHPDLVMSLGVNLELAQALFHQLAYEASDAVSIDEFIFGLIKLTRQSKTIDMLVLDYQQQRAQKDVAKLSRRFTSDMETLQLNTHKLARRLSTTLNDCQPLRSTLKARLKRQIERVHKSTARGTIHGALEIEVSQHSEKTSDVDTPRSEETQNNDKSPQGNASPFLGSWMELLALEGRPRIRHELETALSGFSHRSRTDQGGSSGRSSNQPKPSPARLPASKGQSGAAARTAAELPSSCLTKHADNIQQVQTKI